MLVSLDFNGLYLFITNFWTEKNGNCLNKTSRIYIRNKWKIKHRQNSRKTEQKKWSFSIATSLVRFWNFSIEMELWHWVVHYLHCPSTKIMLFDSTHSYFAGGHTHSFTQPRINVHTNTNLQTRALISTEARETVYLRSCANEYVRVYS